MAVIAMTREMATLGKDVAAGLAERLGLEVVHHELVEQDIAQRAGLRESEVHRFLEGEATLLERWRVDRKRLSNYTMQEMLELAAKGNVLIRGWGATYLLRDIPHVVCVRICAPMAFRVDVLMKRLGMAEPTAVRREIERNDAAHNATMQRMFAANWTAPELYAATFNTARIAPETCVDAIAALASSAPFQATDASHAMLQDRVVEARIRAALREQFEVGARAIGIDIAVERGAVTLSGASSDERIIANIVRTVRAVPGVESVASRIRHVSFTRDV